MVDLETRLALDEDLNAVAEFLKGQGGSVELDVREAEIYWLTLHPRSAPEERYFARLVWSCYPHAPPSVVFASGVGGELGRPRDWPTIAGYRPPNDICMPFTAEGFGLHPEWCTGPYAWRADGNPFLRVAQQLQDDLDSRYGGRAG
jgi:hypothetical protein